MAARKPEVVDADGFGKASKSGNTIAKERENESNPEEDEWQRKWNVENNWGFTSERIFGLALTFFKEMNGKAFNPTYEENLRFVALQKQVFFGPYNPKACSEVGFFDVLGNDRRKEWAQLGSTAKEDAMEDFVKLLNSCCSLFAPYVTSHKIEEEHERRLREEERLRVEREEQVQQQQEEEEEKREEERRQKTDHLLMEQQKQQVMAALNAQITMQSQQCAQGQFSKSPEQQELLIQAHHTHQVQQQQDIAEAPSPNSKDMVSVRNPISQSQSPQSQTNPKPCNLFIEGKPGEVPIMAPSMWMSPQIKEFKEKMQQDAESVITVGRGEVLTVRIPTHEDGSYFFWEFATDYYDIAFGLYFEWPNTVNGQAEEGNGKSENKTRSVVPRVSEVVPLYRRDSHEDVYAGSHQYPAQGVYLLRFDNSYSLWKSKVVYYRVYYTR